MAVKPLTADQKKILYHVALGLVVADLEQQVIKPMVLKEGKPFKNGDFRKSYFKKVPQVAQAERALQKAMKQAQQDLAASFKHHGGGNSHDK
ncbi:hypothetical protein [Shewanella sp. KCT]|uniref:hypothetical protein n=1 Tax=Shewanella sp. KCT TaxID=2569535 RepID=UPI0011841B05|nr:hypothetical protein [Shewanella sp. KCT]TVP08641.1 hypothetical protein AYI87_20980 [Shewanella sp. KCT]